MITRKVVGPEDFLVSSSNTGNQSNPKVSISGVKALVVRDSMDSRLNSQIRGRWIDLKTGIFYGNSNVAAGPDFIIYASTLTKGYNKPQLVMNSSGNIALVLAETYINSFDSISGRLLNVTTGALAGTQEFSIGSGGGYAAFITNLSAATTMQ